MYNPELFKLSKGRYTDAHVYRFEKMCSDFVSVPYKLIVIKSEKPGWWGKIDLFEHENVFYMDLSVAIIKNIDHLIQFKTDFCALRDFINPDKLNSKVMSWQGDNSHVLKAFKPSIMIEYSSPHKWGDQDFIDKHIGKRDYWQDNFPNSIISYKLGKITPETCIIGFHGKPKPEDTEYW